MDLFIVFSFVLAGLTATARLKLKAHSPFEIYLGYSAGLISTAIFFIIVYGF
jgi:membrane-associated phospholipid phosphatase